MGAGLEGCGFSGFGFLGLGAARRLRARVRRADADGVLDLGDEDLAVADAAGVGVLDDRLQGALEHILVQHDLDFHLGQEIDDISAPR